MNTRIEGVARVATKTAEEDARFRVATSSGTLLSRSVVVATGGLSIPKMGATGFGYDLARQLGIALVEPRPGLVPLVFAPEEQARWCDLTGLSAEVVASAPAGMPMTKGRRVGVAPEFREKLLITHRGVSGPAVLQVSSYWRPGAPLSVDLAPGKDVFLALTAATGRRDATALDLAVRAHLPARLAERWLALHVPDGAGRNLSNVALETLERELHAWTMVPAGTEGFAKAEVTAGGVSTAELDPRTLEARRVPGLFFIGEVVDVTGWLGGYNFQWAWSSAVAAADAV
jgi:predicted Rossmann fold flavoprotein